MSAFVCVHASHMYAYSNHVRALILRIGFGAFLTMIIVQPPKKQDKKTLKPQTRNPKPPERQDREWRPPIENLKPCFRGAPDYHLRYASEILYAMRSTFYMHYNYTM